jgi:hypothetical protein
MKVDEVAWRLLREVGPSVEIHYWMTIRDEEVGGYEELKQVEERERGVELGRGVEPEPELRV